MPPKRPAEVLVLESDNEEPTLGPSRPRSSTGAPYGGVNGSSGAASVAPGLDEDAQFEQDIALAMELSLRQTAQAGLLGAAEGVSADLQAAGSSHTFGVGGESRAEMERARLERQRVREMSNPTPPAASTSQGGGSAARPTPRKRFATMADVLQDGSARDRTPRTSSSHGSTQSKTHMRFWDGAVKRVPNDYVPDAEALSFADLIGPASSLQKSVVSAYCLDPFWVASHFEENAPLLLVMPRAQGDTLPTMAPCPVKDNTLRIIPPTNQDLDRAGVMHIKFMVRSLASTWLVRAHRLGRSSADSRPYRFPAHCNPDCERDRLRLVNHRQRSLRSRLPAPHKGQGRPESAQESVKHSVQSPFHRSLPR